MSLLQSIKDAQLAARKAREDDKARPLTTLIGEVTTLAKSDGNREVTDKDVIKTLTKFRDNAMEMARAYGERREGDQMEIYEKEAELYASFLPAAKPQQSAEGLSRSIRKIIAAHVAEQGSKPKMGVIMGELKKLHEGTYDPKSASAVVKAELDGMPEMN